MKQKFIAYIGTYTQSILFGTGQILEGKGEGIYGYSFDIETGAMEPLLSRQISSTLRLYPVLKTADTFML